MGGRAPVYRMSRSVVAAGIVTLGVLTVDLLTKSLAMRAVGPSAGNRQRWLLGDWLGFSYSENSGIAFGLLRDSSTLALTLAMVAAISMLGALVWAHRDDRRIVLGGGLVGGGAVGNLIDRVRFGHVRDFIAVGPWPPFNVADSAITVGALIAAGCLLWSDRRGDETLGVEHQPIQMRSTALDAPE